MPGFTALVVLTLAIGIGATTAIFSVVYGVVLRPLPFPEPSRLVRICEINPAVAGFCVASPPNLMDWSRQSRSFAELGLAREWSFVSQGEERTEEVSGALATPGFLHAFRIAALMGRLLAAADLQPGQPRVAVLSYGFWQRRFGGDPEILGKTLTLDEESYSIVGVLPPEAEIPELEKAQVWLPLPFLEEKHRRWRGFQAVGRLHPGTTPAEAGNEMATLAARLAQQHPETNEGWGVELVPLHERVVGPVRSSLLVFFGAGALVLLIGCTNVVNLLLARTVERRKELALRASLGAGRGHLARLLLAESLLLATLGGAAGIVLAHGLVRVFLSVAPRGIPRLDEVGLDGTVLVFAASVSLLTSLLLGLAPALRAAAPDLIQAIKGGERGLSGPARSRLGAALVVSEVALALVLLIGAGLLLRSFVSASRWQGGFDHRNLLVLSLLCSEQKYPKAQLVADFYRQATAELRTIPAVLSAGAASAGPLFGGRETAEFGADGHPEHEALAARWLNMDAEYFHTLGIPLRKGRTFADSDHGGAPPVAIINETMAHRLWPEADPIGQRVRAARGPTREVVGVVADVKPFWPESRVDPEIYWPTVQQPRWATFLVVRTDPHLPGIADTIQERLRELDPDVSISRVVPFEQILAARLKRPRFNMLLLASFALVALILALGGTYGIVSYNVSRRTHEIGVRMALGADRREILRWVIGRGLKLTAIGIVLGLLGAFALTRVLLSMLYDTHPTDPATFLGTAGLLTLTVLLACYFPARRAARVDPTMAMRGE